MRAACCVCAALTACAPPLAKTGSSHTTTHTTTHFSGVLVLEELSYALKRGARIYGGHSRGRGYAAGPLLTSALCCSLRKACSHTICLHAAGEYIGGAFTCDAHHMTEPLPNGGGTSLSDLGWSWACSELALGRIPVMFPHIPSTDPPPPHAGVRLCIERALASAGVEPGRVSYVNAHATSTPAGDMAEYRAIRYVSVAQCVLMCVCAACTKSAWHVSKKVSPAKSRSHPQGRAAASFAAHEQHQVHDWPPAGRRGRRRGDRHAQGGRDRVAAPHHQPRRPRGRRGPYGRVRGREAAGALAGLGCPALALHRVCHACLPSAPH